MCKNISRITECAICPWRCARQLITQNRIYATPTAVLEIEREMLAAPKLIFVRFVLYNRDKFGTPIACKFNFQKNFLSVGKILVVMVDHVFKKCTGLVLKSACIILRYNTIQVYKSNRTKTYIQSTYKYCTHELFFSINDEKVHNSKFESYNTMFFHVPNLAQFEIAIVLFLKFI